MKNIITITLCLTLLLSGCVLKRTQVPETVSVKDYDGRYIGEHTRKNEAFYKKYKSDAEETYKKSVKKLYGKDVKITRSYPYSWKKEYKSFKSYTGIKVIGTVDYDVPFQYTMNYIIEDEKSEVVKPSYTKDWTPVINAMVYKRYESDIEAARLKFKKEVESQGYFAMNKKLEKQQDFVGVSKQYLNFEIPNLNVDNDDFKTKYKSIMNLQGEEFNQKMDEVIKKHPYFKDGIKTDFIAYFDNKKVKDVNKYSWDLQIPTNETMKKIPGEKSIYFWNGKVSPTTIDEFGLLESTSEEISMDGGMWDEYKKESK
ncbi:hypothetical protein [Mammaliicoccus sp. Dog046]|uniref:hypothetical protein n=1 Tax=Mammaliicoccus sp. Dog046 TaxID=3034233 RepID=UPI002B25DCEE|nr:hypothetical protein [Mammaliicoccus sp. Dog046]WQK86339.1 hypothetical protein P3U32_04835 [Mammaliicoccus sp. Dog046]